MVMVALASEKDSLYSVKVCLPNGLVTFKLDTGSPITIINIVEIFRMYGIPYDDIIQYLNKCCSGTYSFKGFGGHSSTFYKIFIRNVSIDNTWIGNCIFYVSDYINAPNLIGYDLISSYKTVIGDNDKITFSDFDTNLYFSKTSGLIEPIEISELSFTKSNPLLDATDLI